MKQQLGALLSEISKVTSQANKVVIAADTSFNQINKVESDLLQMNLEKLRATLEEAEEVWKENPWHFG